MCDGWGPNVISSIGLWTTILKSRVWNHGFLHPSPEVIQVYLDLWSMWWHPVDHKLTMPCFIVYLNPDWTIFYKMDIILY